MMNDTKVGLVEWKWSITQQYDCQ